MQNYGVGGIFRGLRNIFIRLLSVIGMLVLSTTVFSSLQKPNKKICSKNPMYCTIIKLRPSIKRRWAMRFSNYLYQDGKKFHMDPWRSLAIAMQESSLRNIHRKDTIILFRNICKNDQCRDTYSYISGYSDLSVFQFHTSTIIAYKMDPIKLENNLKYVVLEHYKVLSRKEKECAKLGELSWTCYHSKTPSRRKKYRKSVDKHYYGPDKKMVA